MLSITNHQGNANQNHNEVSPHITHNSYHQKEHDEGVKKRESSYTFDGNVNWCSYCGKQYGGGLKKLKIELPYDPAVPLLGLYLRRPKTLIWKDTCIPVFIAASFTVAKKWRQPRCPSTDEWIGTSLVVQWLILYCQCRGPEFNPWSWNWIPHAALRVCVPQWRSHVPQLRLPHSQINKYTLKKKTDG